MYIFTALRDKSESNIEKAWVLLDSRKIGYVTVEDYRKCLVKCGIYLSKKELNFSFNFIDVDKTNVINFFEFLEFWENG